MTEFMLLKVSVSRRKKSMLKYAKVMTQFGEVECWPTNVLSGNRSVREFVCHIMVGFSN